MAISPPTRRWCWRVRSKKTRWRWPSASCRRSPRRELATGDYRGHGLTVAAARPGFLNIRLAPEVWHAQLRVVLRAGTNFGDSTMGGRRAGQCRIRLGQPDRADACRPRPRRGRRRRARRAARQGRLRRASRILHQRRRRAGRHPRAFALSALPRGAGRGNRRHPRRPLSRRLPGRDRPRAGRSATGGNGSAGRNANGSRRCATSPSTR